MPFSEYLRFRLAFPQNAPPDKAPRPPAGNIKPDKEKSTEKIDGAVTTIMALDRAIRCGNENVESVYDTRGLLFI